MGRRVGKTDRLLGQLHMWAHGQNRRAKHTVGTVTHVGTWVRQTGKAYSRDSYTWWHVGKTDRLSIQWEQLHMVAHGQDRQAKHSVGTVTHGGTWAKQTGKGKAFMGWTGSPCRQFMDQEHW
jgi:hypothetical protein